MKTELEMIVRSTEIDMNGHVNNAKYLEYLEWGRMDWYEQVGNGHYDPEQLGLQTVIVNININYRKECRLGDKLIVVTTPEKAGRKSFTVKQEIIKEGSGELCADAVITSVLLDSSSRQSVEIPDEFRKFFI